MSASSPSKPKQPAKLRAALKRVPLHQLRVLEPASGPGLYLAHFGRGSIGLDSSKQACARAAANGLTVRHVDLDRESWREQCADSDPFEAAWLCDVLMHVADPAAFLSELLNHLAPGAPVLVVEWTLPNRGPLYTLRSFFARRVPGARMVLEEPTHLRFFRPSELEALLRAAGLVIEDHWLHSFAGVWGASLWAKCSNSFWPVRTILARVQNPRTECTAK